MQKRTICDTRQFKQEHALTELMKMETKSPSEISPVVNKRKFTITQYVSEKPKPKHTTERLHTKPMIIGVAMRVTIII